MTRALMVGRFQPFHKGHLRALGYIIEQGFEPLIAIGSAQASFTFDNPFTAAERQRMVEAVLKEMGLEATLATLEDLGDPPRWARKVLEELPTFEAVFSNDEVTVAAFRAHGILVHPIPLEQRGRWQGALIRRQLARKDPAWPEAVPSCVVRIVEALQGVERLKRLAHEGRSA